MINPSEGKEIKQDYLDMLEALLAKIHKSAQKQGMKPSDEITVSVGNERVYKGVIGDKSFEKINPFVSPDLVEKLNNAINNPEKVKGTVSIKIGRDEVYRVKNGEVITDKIGLNNAQSQSETKKLSQDAPKTEELEEKVTESKNVTQNQTKSQGEIEDPIDTLSEQIEKMLSQIEAQDKKIEQLEKMLEEVNNKQLPQMQNTKLQNWVGKIESDVKTAFKGMVDSVTKKVESKIEQGKKLADSQVNKIKDKANNIKTNVSKRVTDAKNTAIESSIKFMLNRLGSKQEDGSIKFESKNFDFYQEGDSITVKSKNGTKLMADGEITPEATQQDIDKLEKVQPMVDQYLVGQRTKSQAVSRGR